MKTFSFKRMSDKLKDVTNDMQEAGIVKYNFL